MVEYIEREKAIERIQPHVKPKTVYGEGYLQAIEHATDILELMPAAHVQPINQWISCKDKMPEEYKTVLVYEKDYGVMIGELEKKFFDTQYFIARKSGMILRTTEVTHWQPIPKPPKED